MRLLQCLLISQSIAVSPTVPPTTAPPLACGKDEKFKKGSWREIFCDGSVEKGPAKDRCLCKGKKTRSEPGGPCVSNCQEFLDDKCPGNQIWQDCVVCWKNCGEPELCMGLVGPDGKCPGGCKCPSGTQWHEEKGTCLPDDQCELGQSCPKGQHWNDCASACEDTCDNPSGSKDPCIEVCMPQCVCDEGLVRDTDGSCKPLKTCKLKECPKGQHWDECGSPCEDTCENPAGSTDVCPEICESKCVCNKGLVRDTDGSCKPLKTCKIKECPANEHFDQCGSDCEETCDPNENQICNMACVARCMCNKGFVRGEKGDCIPKDTCPIPTCPNNQIWTDCKDCWSDCDGTICADLMPGQKCPGGCTCPEGLVLDKKSETCVKKKSCQR